MNSIDKPFVLVVATDEDGGIGKNGSIPWNCPEDLKHFRTLTTTTACPLKKNAVIMGSVTWRSIGSKALPDRINVVISSRPDRIYSDASQPPYIFSSLLEAHQYLDERGDIETQFIIGGASLYRDTLIGNWSRKLYLTIVPGTYDCDRYLAEIPSYWQWEGKPKDRVPNGPEFHLYHNRYTRHLEQRYITQMYRLICSNPTIGRNGLVHSQFNWHWSTDLSDGLPLFSTRQSFWKGICKELLFFISGSTNTTILERDGIKIWEGNTSKEFLKSRGLDYKSGDMGPMYGWVWRHYGAKYRGMDLDYTGQGFDQLRDVIDKLINDPDSRRILLTTYDPSKVTESVLAPCHGIISQFYVKNGYLDMYTYQRSADMFLGVNFNIPSHATLQIIIAKATGLRPGRLYYSFGDNHVYASHTDAVRTLLERTPNEVFPTLEITSLAPKPRLEDALAWIESLKYEDFKVHGYNPQPAIKVAMVV
jgi:dihydrofolate reductase/thymidylate synthase